MDNHIIHSFIYYAKTMNLYTDNVLHINNTTSTSKQYSKTIKSWTMTKIIQISDNFFFFLMYDKHTKIYHLKEKISTNISNTRTHRCLLNGFGTLNVAMKENHTNIRQKFQYKFVNRAMTIVSIHTRTFIQSYHNTTQPTFTDGEKIKQLQPTLKLKQWMHQIQDHYE
jgi:hypothetical protein